MDERDELKETWASVMAGKMIEIINPKLSIGIRMALGESIRDALLEGLEAYLGEVRYAERAVRPEFAVTLESFGTNKINVIKVVRCHTYLGLKEAKDLVESAPATIKAGLAREGAEKLKAELEEAGATASIN